MCVGLFVVDSEGYVAAEVLPAAGRKSDASPGRDSTPVRRQSYAGDQPNVRSIAHVVSRPPETWCWASAMPSLRAEWR